MFWIFLCILKFYWENGLDVDRGLFMVMKKNEVVLWFEKWFEYGWLINWDNENGLKRKSQMGWFWYDFKNSLMFDQAFDLPCKIVLKMILGND